MTGTNGGMNKKCITKITSMQDNEGEDYNVVARVATICLSGAIW